MRQKIDNFCMTIYGEINNNINDWKMFYEDARQIISNFDLEANYFSVDSISYSTKKTIQLNVKNENKLLKSFHEDNSFKSLQILSLPIDFKQAIFDFNSYLMLYKGYAPHHLSFAIKKTDLELSKIEELVNKFSKYINIESGEIYKLSYTESVFFYAMKSKDIEDYEGLHILKKF